MSTQCRVVLEGRIAGTGITKLGTICARLKSELKGRALIIDIKDVMLISQEGENGTKPRVEGVLARCLLQQLARRSKKELSDIIDTSPVENTDVQALTRRESDSASLPEKDAPLR